MFIPIRKLLRTREEAQHLQGSFDFSDSDFPAYTVTQPVPYELHVVPEGGVVRIALQFTPRLQAPCARCLLPASVDLPLEKEYCVRESDLDDEYPELPFTPDGRLDVREMAYQEILMEAPLTLLCSETCKGLCPRCGVAKETCDCPEQPQGDERLQVLRQLLQEE